MTTDPAAPVRVPNVSPGARSGLDHEVIGANAQEAYDTNVSLGLAKPTGQGTLLDVPDHLTTVEELTEWVFDADTDAEGDDRARAVLAAELTRPTRRKTLVEPLEQYLSESDGTTVTGAASVVTTGAGEAHDITGLDGPSSATVGPTDVTGEHEGATVLPDNSTVVADTR